MSSSISNISYNLPVSTPTGLKVQAGKAENHNIEIQSGRDEFVSSGSTKSRVNIFPQDGFMDSKPVEVEIDKSKVGKNLDGERSRVIDNNNPRATADVNGNFLYTPDQPQFDQVNSAVIVNKTLEMHEKNIGRKLDWAFSGDKMTIFPHAKEGKNAYYSRGDKSVNFFYFDSKPLGKKVNVAQSADVVSHEMGHAVLDGMRPYFLWGGGEENRAVHEAFADSTAMLLNLSIDRNLDGIIDETGGDLKKKNRLAMLAEEFGAAIYREDSDPSNDGNTYLRTAQNNFKYVPIDELPSHAGREELSSEAHSYSRILSGAFYDCIANVYESKVDKAGDAPGNMKKALKETGDIMGKLLIKAMDMSAPSVISSKSSAELILKADELLYGGTHKKELTDAFTGRELISSKAGNTADGIDIGKVPANEKEALDLIKTGRDRLNINPALFNQAKVATDDAGNTFIQYINNRETSLGKIDIQGKNIKVYADIQDGFTLTFNNLGKMVSIASDPTYESNMINEGLSILSGDDENLENKFREKVNEAREKDLIVFNSAGMFKTGGKDEISRNTSGEPHQFEIYQEPSGKFKIRHIPVIMD